MVLGTQRWNDLLFLHWEVDAARVQASLPAGLTVDTFGGKAYVGIVPFCMERVRPAFLPPLPWLSWFLELNVRTYVRDAHGAPGVWFYSLDCNQPIGVMLAQSFFHLPYRHARMTARRSDGLIRYRCQRRGNTPPVWDFAWRVPSASSPYAPAGANTLSEFLVERYVLYCADPHGALYKGCVSHTPYEIAEPTLIEHTTAPAALAGFVLSGPPASVLAARAVDVNIHPLVRQR
ncbi:YqjF family protein [Gemmatimonas sp.]|uniref:YqjF family protein n=1 Tax=Gemmatimonas sp. TaxID=1962908 RepID=UPI003DA2C3CA